jgi:hypothetical protein
MRALGIAIAALSIAASLAATALLLAIGIGQVTDSNTIGGFVLGVSYPLLGALLTWRRPRHSMGWIFLGIGLSQAIETFATAYASYGLVTNPGSLPLAPEAAWLAQWAWAPGFGLFIVFSVLLFPDGALPSPRWRPVAYLAVVGILLAAVPVAVAGWPQRGPSLLAAQPQPGLDTPVGIAALLQLVGLLLITVTGALSIASLLLRFRRSRGMARQQLKWFTYAGVFEIGVVLATTFEPLPTGVFSMAPLLVVPLLPIATTVAILRHRLFDIDLIIRRTLIYAVLSAVLAAVYVGAVLLLQVLVRPLTPDNGVAVAASTLLVAALFRPARARVQQLVNRRFFRSSYDAQHVVSSFAAQLRDEVDPAPLAAALQQTIDMAMRPASVSVWLRNPSDR